MQSQHDSITTWPALAVVVERVPAPTADVRALVEELDAELSQNYCCEQRHGLSLDAIFKPDVRFFMASVDGNPAGCGGIAVMDSFAELKRMYVRPAFRGRKTMSACGGGLSGGGTSGNVPSGGGTSGGGSSEGGSSGGRSFGGRSSGGVADAILRRLEEEAIGLGLRVLRLETGAKQTAALRFYHRNGFVLCDVFEPYASMPKHAIAQSVFMEKRV